MRVAVAASVVAAAVVVVVRAIAAVVVAAYKMKLKTNEAQCVAQHCCTQFVKFSARVFSI